MIAGAHKDSLEGMIVNFSFPSFSCGESKSFTYTAETWIPPSRAKNFTVYSMSAKKQAAALPPEEPAAEPPSPSSNSSQPLPVNPVAKPAAKPPAAAAPKAVIRGKPDDMVPFALSALGLAGVGALIVYFIEHRKAGGGPGGWVGRSG